MSLRRTTSNKLNKLIDRKARQVAEIAYRAGYDRKEFLLHLSRAYDQYRIRRLAGTLNDIVALAQATKTAKSETDRLEAAHQVSAKPDYPVTTSPIQENVLVMSDALLQPISEVAVNELADAVKQSVESHPQILPGEAITAVLIERGFFCAICSNIGPRCTCWSELLYSFQLDQDLGLVPQKPDPKVE